MTNRISDERLAALELRYLAPDPHDEIGKCLDCDTASALRELRDLRAERDALQVQIVEERGQHREFELELLSRAAQVQSELRAERDALRELLIEARIRIALDGFPHEIVDRIDAALASQERKL